MIKQGYVYLANLNPQPKKFSSELGKTRPVLVVQHQALLDAKHPSTIVVPLTTQLYQNDLRVRIKAQSDLAQDSDAIIDQVRAIDNRRIMIQHCLCQLPKKTMAEVYQKLHNVLSF